uniref:Integrase catalytic domain-containing protein n=1 Tax=Tanacetum cinerariifolium TaxID=118510 RepID=A0A6L2K9U7_TANCI|nr:hypothetical protein [Tanacetum cinerariifolium]
MAFSSSNSSSDNEVPSCSKACSKAYAQLHSQYDKLAADFRKSQFDVISYQTESDESWPPSSLYDRFQPSDGYHDVPPPYTGIFMPPKPNLHVETSIPAATPKLASPKPASSGKRRNRKACFLYKSMDHLIKDCDFHAKKMAQPTPRNQAHRVLTQSKPESITTVRPVSAVVPKIKVTRPRHAKPIVTQTNSPIRKHITRSPSPITSNSPPRVTTVKAPVGNPQHTLKDKGVIDSGYSRHMIGNMSYLSDFEELNGGYVAFGGLPSKVFENDNTCVACKKGKKHKASYKTKPVSSVNQPLYRLHVDLFGPTFVKSLNKKSYCLVVTDDYSRSDNGTEFKNNDLNQFCGMKGIKREFSVPRTPQQNGIAERKNTTLIEAARIMLTDSLLSIPFWAEAVNTACYVQNRVLVTKPHNKTPYELLHGRTPSISFMRPFGCPVTILNTLDSLGKFDGKVDEGFLVGCSNNDGDATFDGKEHDFDAKKPESEVSVSPSSSAQSRKQDDKTKKEDKGKTPTVGQNSCNSTNTFSADGPSNAAASPTYGKSSFIGASQLPDDPDMPELEDSTYSNDEDNVGTEADFNNLESSIIVSLIPTTRFHKDHPVSQFIGDLSSTTQTRSLTRVVKDQGGLSHMFNDDFYTCMFACFISQEEPKRVHQALKDTSWIETMQEELLQFKMQKVWVLVDFPYGKRAIGTKWVFRNKKDERGIVIRNKARLFAQEHTQEEGINYEEVFALVSKIEAIRLFLAYASFMSFMVYQMDVKSAFLYGTIEEEVYVCQPLGFEDPDHPDKVYKVVKALYGLHQTLFIKRQKGDILLVQIYVNDIIFSATNKDLCKSFEKLMKDKFQMSSMGELTYFLGLQVKQNKDGIFISQDKYVAKILRKFRLTEGKSTSTPIDIEKPLLKDPDGKGFSRVETPLFEGMLVEQEIDKEGDADEHVEEVNISDAAHGDVSVARGEVQQTPPQSPQVQPPSPQPQPQQAADFPMTQALEITKLKRRVKKLEKRNKVRVLKLRRLHRVGTSQRVAISNDTVMDDESNQERMIAKMDQDDVVVLKDDKDEDKEVVDAVKDVEEAKEDEAEPAKVQEVVDVVTTTKLITEVVTAASETVTAASAIVTAVEAQVPAATLTVAPARIVAAPSKRRKRVLIRDPESGSATSTIIPTKTKSKDKGKGILTKEQIEEDENRALQKLNETPAKRAAKRRKLDEEVEELRRHLQIMPNKDDDVYTKATPLARKVPVVDYQIIEMNNKPHYKIIKADDTHQLYISFLSLLRNFDREDLEALWSKGQRMEATRIMWCADHNVYIYLADFVSGKEVPAHKIHSRPDAECCKALGRGGE